MTTRDAINKRIYEDGSVNRNHLADFLRTIETNDSMTVEATVRQWLQELHDDPHYSKISFPRENIDGLGVSGDVITRVLSDLQSYGRVTHETLIGAPDTIVPDITTLSSEQE